MARQWVMAAMFGVSSATDSWLMASVIPTLLFEIIGGGYTMVLVPMLAGRSTTESGDPSVTLSLDEIFTWTVVVSLIMTGFLEIVAPRVVHLIAPGFQRRFALTVLLLRIMLPAGLTLVLGNFMNAILQARRIYHTVATTPIIINVVRIATMLTMGIWWHIIGVAIGFVLANVAQLAYLIAALARYHVRLHWRLSLRQSTTREYLHKVGPTILAHSAQLGGTIVDRIFASTLAVGRIAALNFAQVLAQMPLTLALNPVVTPLFSDMSQEFNRKGSEARFRQLVQRVYELALAVVGPTVLMLIIWRLPLVILVYQHGHFNAAASRLTARLVLYWALGLPAEALGIVGSRILLAQHHVRTATTAAIGAMLSNIVGDFLLIRPLGSAGLVIATAIAAVIRVIIQSGWLLSLKTSPWPSRLRFWWGWGLSLTMFGVILVGGTHLAHFLRLNAGYQLGASMGIIGCVAIAAYGMLLMRTGIISGARLLRGR